MKLISQITLGIVAAAVILFVGLPLLTGAIDAVECVSRYGTHACQAKLDRNGHL